MAVIKVKDTELPPDVFKCAQCCKNSDECDCEEGYHYEDREVVEDE